jgi:hypothetical protein
LNLEAKSGAESVEHTPDPCFKGLLGNGVVELEEAVTVVDRTLLPELEGLMEPNVLLVRREGVPIKEPKL